MPTTSKSPAAADAALFGQPFDFFFQVTDAITGSPAADFQNRFPGSSSTDAACKTREAGVLFRKARQGVLQLRQFHLEFPVPASGPLSENVENQLRTVNGFKAGTVLERPGLGGFQVDIEYGYVSAPTHGCQCNALQAAKAYDRPRMYLSAGKLHDFGYIDTGCTHQLDGFSPGDFSGGND